VQAANEHYRVAWSSLRKRNPLEAVPGASLLRLIVPELGQEMMRRVVERLCQHQHQQQEAAAVSASSGVEQLQVAAAARGRKVLPGVFLTSVGWPFCQVYTLGVHLAITAAMKGRCLAWQRP
jgi:hypothetical protein